MARPPKRDPVAPPTIGHFRRQGLTGARVFCSSLWCGHMVLVAFDDLGLADATPFPAIRNRKDWRCQRCGGRDISVMPDWRDPRDVQNERMSQDNGQP